MPTLWVVLIVFGFVIMSVATVTSGNFVRALVIMVGGFVVATGSVLGERAKFNLEEIKEGTEYKILWCEEDKSTCLLGEYRGTTEGTIRKFYGPKEEEKKHMVVGKTIKKTTATSTSIAVIP